MYESFLPPPPADIAPARSSGGDGNPLEQALAAERVTGPLADVARSVYHQESGSGSNTKTSNAGARGGMQIIPSTFASVADKGWDINDPVHNARGGVRYLKQLFEQSGGDPGLTAAGYYGGPGGMEKARRGIAVSDPRNPDAPNTLQYAQQVTSRLGASGAGIPASAAARAPVEQNDTPYYTPVTRHASLLPPPPPEEGVLASMGTALSQGAKSTARSIGAALNNLTGDLSGVENNRLAQLAAAEQDPAAKRSLMAEIEARKAANPDAGVLQAVGDVGSAALQNPLGTAQFVAEQAPNAVVSLGGGLAGSKLGALAGTPLGPVGIAVGGTVGFLAGMFLGNSLLEIGGKSIEKAEGGFTQGEANDALREGAVKGAVVTGVDAATLGAGKLISRGLSAGAVKAGARAEAQVLAAAGVDITSGEKIVAALADPALRASAAQAGQVAAKAASTLGNRATQAGTILATETVGEGAGEYYGELAATGKADLYDAATEALAGFAQSAPETFMAMTHSASTSMDPKAIRASAIEQQRQTELAPVQAAADAGGSLSKAAMAGNTGPLAAAQYAAGKEQELATQQQTAQAEQQANTPAADPLTARVRAITEEARNTGLLQALRAEGSPVDAKQFVNDLAIAQSPSTRPDQREQALSRLEYAASWVTGAKPLVPVGQPGNEPGQPGNEPGQSRNEPGQSKNEPGNTRNEPGQTANDLLSSNALSDADRQALTASLSASTNPALPQATRQAARQTANEIIGRNTAGAATTPLAPTAGTPALFAPKAAPAGSPEEVLAKARQQEDNAGQLTAMGYPDEAATATAQADLLREEAKVRQSATPDAPQAATKTVAASAGQASAAAEDAAPGKDVPAPSVATPSGTGTAQFRKRRAVLGALIADGLNQVERRNDGNFYLVDPSRKRQFKLDNAADAQLARKAREDAIRAAADETAKKISDAQKIAGNYKKGRPDFEDLKIGIETPIGSERSGKAPDGTPWSVTMTADYGDITSTKGGDGEAVDIYLAPNPKEGSPVFVIDQYNGDGTFDEHKVVLGVATEAEATVIYDAHFSDGSGPRRRKAVTAMSIPEFKTWVHSPAATQPAGKPNGTTGPNTKQGAAARPAAGAPDAGAGMAAGELGSGNANDARTGAGTGRAAPAAAGPAAAAETRPNDGYVTIRVGGQERQVALVNDPAANDASPPRADGARRINKANAALLHKLAGALGKKVQFFRDDTLGDGFVDPATPGTIYLNEVSTIHPLAVFGHEFLHQLRQSMPAAHASLMKVVRAKLKKDGAYKFRNDYYKADAGPNPNSALNSAELEEITSDIGGNFMADVSFWAEVFAQVQKDSPAASKSLISRMATQLFKLVDKLVDGIKQGGFGSSALVNDLKGVRVAFKDALAQYMTANNLTQAGMRAEALKAEQQDAKASSARASSVTDTPEFKKWFSTSKVVNEDGSPKVVYHGTFDDFDAFRLRTGDIGIHFGDAETAGDRIADGVPHRRNKDGKTDLAANIMPAYLSLVNPIRLRDFGFWNAENMKHELLERFPNDAARIGPAFARNRGLQTTKDIREFLQSKGHDGVVYKNTGEVAGSAPFRERIRVAKEAVDKVFPKGKNSFSPDDQKVPEYKAWSEAQAAYAKHRETAGTDSYIVFAPTQIKSATGNNGDFNAKRKEITRSAARSPETGIHFSKQQRSEIDGRQYGTGMKGQELARLNSANDERLLARAYVYIDEGRGVTPETGVGTVPHEVKLPRLYDARVNADKLWNGGNLNATESAILDAGYSGYYVSGKDSAQGVAVVLGKASHQLKARPIAVAQNGAADAEPAKASRGLMSKELNAIEPANIPGATLKNGTLTIPMNSREAANDEMSRIGSAVRFSPARTADAPADQYAATLARLKDTDQWLKAPNGQATRLTERQWVQVRTPAFKAWFGDWEKFASQKGGVWADGQGEVSKAVDDNGEPIVVYHGTDTGGFAEFRKPGGTRRGDLGIFTTSNEEMARSYVRRGYGRRIAAIDDSGDKISGVYASFINLRTPNESDFEGANWDGQRLEQWVLEDAGTGDQLYAPDGRGFFNEEQLAAELERLNDLDISAIAREADDHYESTDGVMRDARRDKQDGAIVRQVMDDGGGNSGYWGAPSDVFVAFEPGQLKSADFNDGSFSVSTSDIRFSAGREQTETAAFKEWFGDSKVVDAEGDPLVVYHGTNNDFKEFDSSRLRTGAGDSVFGAGFYFTPSPRYAESYGPNVMSVYLALQKPYLPGYSEAADARVADKVSAAGYTELPEMSGDAQRAILESLGFDGVIAKEHPEDYDKEGVEQWDEIVVFSPSSIKSTRNGGGFSYASNDITQSAKRDPAIGDRTDVARLPKGKAIPASAAIGSLEDSLTLARSKSYAKGRQLKVDIQDRVLAAAKSAKVDLSAKTQETFKFLTGLVVKDARLALQSNENAIGWYDKTVSRAIGALATVHPEIETDPKARLAFLWALATTSNGLKVGQNFKIAEEVYRGWKATGVMPSDAGIGNAKASIDKGLALYNTLAAKMGHERLFKFMATEFEVGQIGRMLGEAPGGEWMPTPVLGSAVLGPKIGNGFFSNLNGYFSALTMDRWLMRTWGRMTGTLLEVLPEKVAKSRTKLATSIASMNDTERKLMAKLIGTPLRRSMTRAELDAVSLAVQKTTMKPENRAIMDASPGSSRLRLDGNGHAKMLDGQKEAPAGPAERNWIRAVFTEALGELNTGGKAMTMSDLQALLWYPERRLYDAAKSDEDVADGYEDDEAPDYANAAQQLALKNGVKPEVITAAMDRAEKRGTVQGKRLSDAEKQAMLQEFRAPPEQAVQLAFEVAPDPADAGLIAQWGRLSLKDRTAITKKAKDAVLDELIDAVGAKVGKTVGATGGYMGLVNPNLITEYKHTQVPIEQARALASAIGLALDQDSVALVDPRAEYGAGLLRINFNGKVDKHAAAIFDALHAAIPEIDAFTARGNNFDVLNFTDMTNEALHDKMQDALADLSIPLEGTISFGDIKSELVEKADYENHIAGLRPGAGQEILGRVERARDRAREIVAQEIRSASDRGLQPRARKGAGRAAAARLDDVKLSANRDGDGAGRDQGRGLAPLAGAPTVQGAAGPDPRLVEVAEKYARANGITLRRQVAYAAVDPARAQRIAQAYESMPHAPQDPQVKAAYADLIRQTRNQYDALVNAGYRFTFFDSASDPYQGNPWNAMRELRKSHSMAVYGTYDGYGTEGVTDEALASNPMLADTGLQWRDQAGDLKPVLANDLFRAVHDAFGHGLEGAGFRAQGEENAWQAHVRLFTGPAVGAITSETRGQNSWLNYGPNGEANLNAKVEDTVFADQKTGLMPAWTWQEGIAGDEIRQSPARLEDAPLVELRKQLSVLESLRKCLG